MIQKRGRDAGRAECRASQRFPFAQRRSDLWPSHGRHLAGFDVTLDKVLRGAPDRIALYSYAHVPHLFKPQRRINEAELPSPDTKLAILELAIKKLTDAGYIYIGHGSFRAAPTTNSQIAQREGKLHRNFQGYSTQADCDLVALGISAIGKVGRDLQPERAYPR